MIQAVPEAIKTYEANCLMQCGLGAIAPSQQNKSSMQESQTHTYENGKNIDN